LRKDGLATIWAIFSQTHLVSLSNIGLEPVVENIKLFLFFPQLEAASQDCKFFSYFLMHPETLTAFNLFNQHDDQGCQIFLSTKYQNGEKYQIATNYTKCT
jgi:hypothetical protein